MHKHVLARMHTCWIRTCGHMRARTAQAEFEAMAGAVGLSVTYRSDVEELWNEMLEPSVATTWAVLQRLRSKSAAMCEAELASARHLVEQVFTCACTHTRTHGDGRCVRVIFLQAREIGRVEELERFDVDRYSSISDIVQYELDVNDVDTFVPKVISLWPRRQRCRHIRS